MSKTYYGTINPDTGTVFLIENPGNIPIKSWQTGLEVRKLEEAFSALWHEGAGKIAVMPKGLPDLLLNEIELPHNYTCGGGSGKPRIWLTQNKRIKILADGDIDADGSPRAKTIDPGNGQTQTSFGKDNGWDGEGDYVNSEKIPYFVLPLGFARVVSGDPFLSPSLGDMAKLTYNGKTVYALFADEGPEGIIGELSIAAAEALGFNPWNAERTKLRNVGIPFGVTYEIIPRTFQVSPPLARPCTFDAIQALGKMLFQSGSTPVWKLKGKGIVLNPGHGGRRDCGALGKNESITEAEMNWLQVNRISVRLHESGVPHVIVSQDDLGGSLQAVGEACKGFDVGIFCHHNAYDHVEHYTCCMRQDGGPDDEMEHKLGSLIAQNVGEAIGNKVLKPDGIMKTGLTVNRYAHKVGAMGILVESHFIDDETDRAECVRKSLLAAEAIANTLITFFRA